MNKFTRNTLLMYGIIILNGAVHFPILYNEIINWHDEDLFSVLKMLSHQPLERYWEYTAQLPMLLIYALQFAVGGNGYFIYHAVSVMLHTLNVILLFFIVLRFGWEWKTALVVALIFSLHPIHIEPVAWVSKQPVLLTTALMLGTVYCILGYYRFGNRRSFYLSLILGALGFITAPMFGLLWILGMIMVHHRRHSPIQYVTSLLPFVLFFGLGVLLNALQTGGEHYVASLTDESLRMMQGNIINHIQKFLSPWTAMYVPPNEGFALHRESLVSVFFFCSLLCLLLLTIKDDVFRSCAVLSMCLLLPLLSGIGHGDTLFMESSYYLASIPFFVMMGDALTKWSFGHRTKWSVLGSVLMILYLIVCGVQSLNKSSWWKTSESLWTGTLSRHPDNVFALNKLSMYHFSRYEYDEAKRFIDKALEVKPLDVESRFHRGIIEYEQMDLHNAITDLSMVIQADSTHPLALYHMALAHNEYSRYDSVIAYCTKAIAVNPSFVQALNNRGNTYAKTGRLVEANVDYNRVIALDPSYGDGYGNRALLYLQAGNIPKALNDLKKQVELSPYRIDARIHYALTSILSADTITAKVSFSEARKLDSTNSELYLKSVLNTFLRSSIDQNLANSVIREVFNK